MNDFWPKRFTIFHAATGLGAAISLMLATHTLAKIPDGKELPSNKQFLERVYAFESRHCLNGYDAHGMKNPKWDAAARDFIDQFLRASIRRYRTSRTSSLRKREAILFKDNTAAIHLWNIVIPV